MEIKAAINVHSLDMIRTRLERVTGKLSLVQIDMSDGVYTKNRTYGHAGNKTELQAIVSELIKYKLDVEYDLMIDFKNQPLFFERWISFIDSTKPKRVIFHLDSLTDQQLREVFEIIDERSTKIFLGLGVTQDVSGAVEKCNTFNFEGVQVMGIENLGFSGQEFSPRALLVLRHLKEELPGRMLMVDGGVSLANAEALAEAGATSLASTSGIFSSENIETAILSFMNVDKMIDPHKSRERMQ